jgi:pSer/pThr/pTyr-binding forkhead associated (FHA) protein
VVTVGRTPNSTIVLADPNVSRNHAEIRPVGTGYVVVDLQSTNGTRVNGIRIANHELDGGDQITFGNTVLRFEAS